MKNIIILSFLIVLFTGCGKESEIKTVIGVDGTEYSSYQDACRNLDFDAAYKLVELNGGDKNYVFKQEALYLMSLNDETAKRRLIYLIKQEGGNNYHVSMLIDLAIEDDDEVFVKRLANLYNKHVPTDDLKKLSEYLSSKKNGDNQDYLVSLYKKIGRQDMLLEYGIDVGDVDFIIKNEQNIDLNNEEIISKLAKLNDRRVSEIIIGRLSKYEEAIPNRPAMGIVKSDHYGEIPMEYRSYESRVDSFKDKCLLILNCAIKTKNKHLAQRSLSRVKPNIEYNDLGDWVRVIEKKSNQGSVYNTFDVKMSNEDIKNANAIYQSALKSGAFR